MGIDIETMMDCASNYGVFIAPSDSNPYASYTVTFHGSEGPAHCTCPAYRFSESRDCKHIERVWEGACMYNPQWCEGHIPVQFEPVGYTYTRVVLGESCPACGGPVVAVRRAV